MMASLYHAAYARPMVPLNRFWIMSAEVTSIVFATASSSGRLYVEEEVGG